MSYFGHDCGALNIGPIWNYCYCRVKWKLKSAFRCISLFLIVCTFPFSLFVTVQMVQVIFVQFHSRWFRWRVQFFTIPNLLISVFQEYFLPLTFISIAHSKYKLQCFRSMREQSFSALEGSRKGELLDQACFFLLLIFFLHLYNAINVIYGKGSHPS